MEDKDFKETNDIKEIAESRKLPDNIGMVIVYISKDNTIKVAWENIDGDVENRKNKLLSIFRTFLLWVIGGSKNNAKVCKLVLESITDQFEEKADDTKTESNVQHTEEQKA
jgi:hypothetical protein